MDSRIKALLSEQQITLKYDELDCGGLYVDELNWIIVDNRLNEHEQEKVILHELGHAAKQKGLSNLYNATTALHTKMEAEANRFMIREELENYRLEYDETELSPVKFLESFGLPLAFEPYVSKVLSELLWNCRKEWLNGESK